MGSYLRPRRGKKATATSQGIVLKRGEVFFECPDTGVGTGKGKIKVGDGSSAYASLPYFMEDTDVGNATVAFTDSSTATDKSNNTTYLTNIKPANSLITLLTNLKQLLVNYNSQLTALNNDLPFPLAISGSTYGYKKTDGTFVGFRKPTGNATSAQVLSGYTFSNASGDGLTGSYVAPVIPSLSEGELFLRSIINKMVSFDSRPINDTDMVSTNIYINKLKFTGVYSITFYYGILSVDMSAGNNSPQVIVFNRTLTASQSGSVSLDLSNTTEIINEGTYYPFYANCYTYSGSHAWGYYKIASFTKTNGHVINSSNRLDLSL